MVASAALRMPPVLPAFALAVDDASDGSGGRYRGGRGCPQCPCPRAYARQSVCPLSMQRSYSAHTVIIQ